MNKRLIAIFLCLFVIQWLIADTLLLNNRVRYQGQVTGYDSKDVYFITSNGEKVLFKRADISQILYTKGIRINEHGKLYPDDFYRYSAMKLEIATDDSIAVADSTINLYDNPDYLFELQKINGNLQMIWIPMWFWSGISIVALLVYAGKK